MHHIPRKRFGQHFLVDAQCIADIVDSIYPRPEDALIEIGPGLGALTHSLVVYCKPLTVIELDRDLAGHLRSNPHLHVIESDVLQVDFASLASERGHKLRVVGNLPYNISTPILFHLLTYADQIKDQHFMLQKEVVERMVAAPGSKDYGRLSVMLQWRYAMENVLSVPPSAFDPPPRVHSAVVRMRSLAQPPACNLQVLSEVVRVAFSQRRKLLRHTLGRWLEEHALGAGFNTQRRAEEVPVGEYVALAAVNSNPSQ